MISQVLSEVSHHHIENIQYSLHTKHNETFERLSAAQKINIFIFHVFSALYTIIAMMLVLCRTRNFQYTLTYAALMFQFNVFISTSVELSKKRAKNIFMRKWVRRYCTGTLFKIHNIERSHRDSISQGKTHSKEEKVGREKGIKENFAAWRSGIYVFKLQH